MSLLDLFRYARLVEPWGKIFNFIGWIAALSWLYFAIIHKELVAKILAGQAELMDLLIGLPLVLALAIVIYASVVWSFKLVVIFVRPSWLYTLEEDEAFYASDEIDDLDKQDK